MRLPAILGIASGAGVAAVGLPALLLARRLENRGFDPGRDHAVDPLDLQVTAISDETVTLRPATKAPGIRADEPGQYLLQAARGWGYAGRVIDCNEIISIREFRPGAGDIRAGDYGRLDGFAQPIDPMVAHGLPFENVQFASPLGDFPAWYLPGTTGTWAIMTHGKGADRREALRILPALVASRFHCLAITYRNDIDVSPSPSGRYSYGKEEWEELDGAVAYALDHGATDVVLVGYSMGGAITLSFMENSEYAEHVSALILDAPMTDLEETVKHGAAQAGLPLPFLAISNRVAALLYRFRWSDFDYLKTAPRLSVPVLLFHGTNDRTIPVELSDSFAAARPDIVQYVRVPDADHVRAWNMDPVAYEQTVRDFVRTRRSVRAGQ
ncbi:MAG: alpha/beta fold hydrolase [Dehalococcoidia bacterium]